MQFDTYLGDLTSPLTEKIEGFRKVLNMDEPWEGSSLSSVETQDFFDHYLPFCVQLMNEIGFEGISNERKNIRFDIHRDEVTTIQETTWLHPKLGVYNLHLVHSDGVYVCNFWRPSSRETKFSFNLEGQHRRRTNIGNGILEVIRSEYRKSNNL